MCPLHLLTKMNHMRSVADLGLTFQLHSLRMSTGAQQKTANSHLLCPGLTTQAESDDGGH